MAEQKTTAKRGRPATKTATKIDNTEEKDAVNALFEQMQAQMKAQQEQIEMLTKQLADKNSDSNNVIIKSNNDATRTVKVVSMLPNTYVLRVKKDPKEKGRVYKFNKFGETQNIRFSDMIEIMNNYTSQFERGWAILTSKKDYEDLGYAHLYEEVMTKEQFEKLIQLNDMESVDIILDMDDETIEKVIAIIAQRLADGYTYDFNMLQVFKEEGYDIAELKELISAK